LDGRNKEEPSPARSIAVEVRREGRESHCVCAFDMTFPSVGIYIENSFLLADYTTALGAGRRA
jgi:hypothetical protein